MDTITMKLIPATEILGFMKIFFNVTKRSLHPHEKIRYGNKAASTVWPSTKPMDDPMPASASSCRYGG